jgi:ParB family transcriptional regulator, chromosome partitioning protein
MSGVELKGLKGLKGLDNLLQDSKQNKSDIDNLATLPLERLVSGKYQPRSGFDEATLQDLADSMRAQGILQPLIVRRLDCEYEIIAGERRWRAAKIAGLTEVPVIIRNVPDNTALAFALIENIQREDLNPVDQATALDRLMQEFSMTHEEVAMTIGRSRPAVTNLLRLLTLPSEIKELLRRRKVDMGHARALLTLEQPQQIHIANKIAEKNLSVREAEDLVQKIKRQVPFQDHAANPELEQKVKQWSKTLTDRLSSPVKVLLNRHGEGKIVIQVNSLDEVEWLAEHIRADEYQI